MPEILLFRLVSDIFLNLVLVCRPTAKASCRGRPTDLFEMYLKTGM